MHSVKFTPKIRDCTPTFIINYIMIFETPRRRYPNFCVWNAPWPRGRAASEGKISVINRLSRFITNLYHSCGGFLTYFAIFKNLP